MIKNLVATLQTLQDNEVLFEVKLKELKEVLKAEHDQLTKDLYNDTISYTKYLAKVDSLYTNLKEAYYVTD